MAAKMPAILASRRSVVARAFLRDGGEAKKERAAGPALFRSDDGGDQGESVQLAPLKPRSAHWMLPSPTPHLELVKLSTSMRASALPLLAVQQPLQSESPQVS